MGLKSDVETPGSPALQQNEIAALPNEIAQIITRNYHASPHGTSLSLVEAIALAAVVYDKRPVRTLEIGFAEGGSAAAIVAAKTCAGIQTPHIVLDPYQKSHSLSRGLQTIESLGLRDNLVLIEQRSDVFLPGADQEYDFVFIDGGHDRGQAMVDAYFADRHLVLGGIIAIDDIYLKNTSHSLDYLVEDCGYEILTSSYRRLSLPRMVGRSLRLGPRFGLTYSRSGADAVAFVRKTRHFHGGY